MSEAETIEFWLAAIWDNQQLLELLSSPEINAFAQNQSIEKQEALNCFIQVLQETQHLYTRRLRALGLTTH